MGCQSGRSQRLPKHDRLLLLPLVAPQGEKVHPRGWRHHALQIQTWTPDDLSWIWPESLFLRTSFYGVGCHQAKFQRKQTTNSPTQLWHLWVTTGTRMAPYLQDYNSGIHVVAATNSFLIEPTRWKGNHAWCWKPSRLLRAHVMALGVVEATSVSLLNQHNS